MSYEEYKIFMDDEGFRDTVQGGEKKMTTMIKVCCVK